MSPLLQALLKVLRGSQVSLELHPCVEGTKSRGVPAGQFGTPSPSGVKRIEQDTGLWLSAPSPLEGAEMSQNMFQIRAPAAAAAKGRFNVETRSWSWAVF